MRMAFCRLGAVDGLGMGGDLEGWGGRGVEWEGLSGWKMGVRLADFVGVGSGLLAIKEWDGTRELSSVVIVLVVRRGISFRSAHSLCQNVLGVLLKRSLSFGRCVGPGNV